jgi:AraC-like DNA-binding protein
MIDSPMRAESTSPGLIAQGGIQISQPPLFATRDVGECRDYIRGFTGTHTFDAVDVSSMVYFSHHEHRMSHISLNYTSVDCTEGFRIGKAAGADCYAFQFVLEGQCELADANSRYQVSPGDVFVLGPDEITREHWKKLCRQFVVRVDRKFVDQLVANEIRSALKRPLRFKKVGRDPGIVSWLQQIVNTPAGTAQVQSVLDDRRVSRSMEAALTMMLLVGFEHSESVAFQRPTAVVAPYYVKRAEEFIRTHARDDLTVESIAAAAGVSVRSLFYGFKHWRNTTPMAHLRELRLMLARKELLENRHRGGMVSEAAINAGFTNFSQFSKIYKLRFGETPSMTLCGI